MKKLLVIGVLMSVMLVGCGTQKETTAVESSTASNVVAEAVTEVLTETTEAIEETTTVVEETTEETTVVEETETETTTVEETTEEVVEETTVVEETVVEAPAPVEEAPAEESTPAAEEPAPAPVEEAPAEEPASTGSTTWDVWCPTPGMSESLQQTAASMGLTVTIVPTYTDGYDVTINTTDDTLVNAFYEAIACWGDSILK